MDKTEDNKILPPTVHDCLDLCLYGPWRPSTTLLQLISANAMNDNKLTSNKIVTTKVPNTNYQRPIVILWLVSTAGRIEV